MEKIREGYTRVTQPLQLFNEFSNIDPIVLSRACDRGTKVHKYCEMHVLGEYFPEPSDSLIGYLNSFRRWYDLMVVELISSEGRFYDEIVKVTGAIDIVAILQGDTVPTIIDIKTSAVEAKTWCLQTAMYRHLYNGQGGVKLKAERRIALRVDKGGGMAKVYEYTDYERDIKLYMGILNAWRFFK